jgi:hypothetical protein
VGRVVRLRLDETDFAELVKGKVVTKEGRTSAGGTTSGPGRPLDVTVFITLDDIGLTVMEGLIDEARKG